MTEPVIDVRQGPATQGAFADDSFDLRQRDIALVNSSAGSLSGRKVPEASTTPPGARAIDPRHVMSPVDNNCNNNNSVSTTLGRVNEIDRALHGHKIEASSSETPTPGDLRAAAKLQDLAQQAAEGARSGEEEGKIVDALVAFTAALAVSNRTASSEPLSCNDSGIDSNVEDRVRLRLDLCEPVIGMQVVPLAKLVEEEALIAEALVACRSSLRKLWDAETVGRFAGCLGDFVIYERIAFLCRVGGRLDELEAYEKSCGLSDEALALVCDLRQELKAGVLAVWDKLPNKFYGIDVAAIQREFERLAGRPYFKLALPKSKLDVAEIGARMHVLVADNREVALIEAINPSTDGDMLEVRARFKNQAIRPGALVTLFETQMVPLGGVGRPSDVHRNIPVRRDAPSLQRQLALSLLLPGFQELKRLHDKLSDNQILSNLASDPSLTVDRLVRHLYEQPKSVEELRRVAANIHEFTADGELDALCKKIESELRKWDAKRNNDLSRAETYPLGAQAEEIDAVLSQFLSADRIADFQREGLKNDFIAD